MSFRKLSRYSCTLRSWNDHLANNISLLSETKHQSSRVSSSVFAVSCHRKLHCSKHTQQLRIEGIQGPIPASISIKDCKKMLAKAASFNSSSTSRQGVQGSYENTDRAHHNNANQSPSTSSKKPVSTVCPQGIQGDTDLNAGCDYYNAWLHNCIEYGLADCDQKLQGIQSGRLTLAQVLAEQEAQILEITERYRIEAQDVPSLIVESMQVAQDQMSLPNINTPCPEGVQGDDCVQFKLWLENCHSLGLHDCEQQLVNLRSGRLTLAQLFDQQDHIIRQVVQQYQQSRQYSTQAGRDNSPAAAAAQPVEAGVEQLSQKERLKRAVKEYGSTVIIFHITISLASLGGFYLAVSSGIDMVGMLKSLGVGEAILQSKLATGTGTFVVAYAVHKVFAPVRIGITLTATPFIVRYLRSKGILKVPKKT